MSKLIQEKLEDYLYAPSKEEIDKKIKKYEGNIVEYQDKYGYIKEVFIKDNEPKARVVFTHFRDNLTPILDDEEEDTEIVLPLSYILRISPHEKILQDIRLRKKGYEIMMNRFKDFFEEYDELIK